ncbi:dTDP-4-dehydrorhamnose reductase [Vibrio anguillarum]|uniref:dTDP-4-dehydrorhamnose reductase n=1 Tax=Vibrio anguillarum TaxID=55601 RepID=A0ABD4QVW3_VIBAN|nr:dTDP-4-dehydrorhamnose reductase [Vibrio anguillarum]ASG04785.1 NAD(P)-dependent oxidoreductase [Vibrio anguillarum]MBF4244696.1 dTDP-4-dehydrorhamnose reductase [Vibrio anguillarum]MBT2919411.1 dTDP-4-dehydrorhamnose reductase [Vibrio anguillarum]
MMRVLVTGSHGQVGYCLAHQLNSMVDVEFLAVDREQLDITNPCHVNSVVNEFKPNIIINAAAHTAVDRAEQEAELSYAINRDGPKHLAQAAHKVGAAILHISTDYVFSGDKPSAYIEADPTSPLGVYGKSKLAGEIAVAQACPRHIILRTAWVFGEHGNNFVKTMLRLAQTRDALGVVSDQYGGPTYAGDIANALLMMAKAIVEEKPTAFGVYHFSGTPHVSWYDFACAIFDKAREQELLNKPLQVNAITTKDYPTSAKRPANSKLDTQKIHQHFGVVASDWRAALNHLIDYKSE